MAKQYDLEERTEKFTSDVITMCKKLVNNTINIELMKQVVRASGSIGANYIEANEALGKKDFAHKIKISRKESKESRYWLRLLSGANKDLKNEIDPLIQEATELMNIFGAILRKAQ
jgi:four helix bundle protein